MTRRSPFTVGQLVTVTPTVTTGAVTRIGRGWVEITARIQDGHTHVQRVATSGPAARLHRIDPAGVPVPTTTPGTPTATTNGGPDA